MDYRTNYGKLRSTGYLRKKSAAHRGRSAIIKWRVQPLALRRFLFVSICLRDKYTQLEKGVKHDGNRSKVSKIKPPGDIACKASLGGWLLIKQEESGTGFGLFEVERSWDFV